MDWLKDVIDKIPGDLVGIVIIAAFAIYIMFKCLVWAFKIIERFSDSETEMARTLEALKVLIEVLVNKP